MDGLKTGRKSSYASDVITWTEEDRLTQLATGVARSMYLHWLTIL
jgi:hypothetical protein